MFIDSYLCCSLLLLSLSPVLSPPGFCEGAGLGVAIGSGVDVGSGVAVGSGVGVGVGVAVGAGVGVGVAVGAAVGVGVGAVTVTFTSALLVSSPTLIVALIVYSPTARSFKL